MEFQKPAFKYSKPVKKDIQLPDIPKKRLKLMLYTIFVFSALLVILMAVYFIGDGNDSAIGIPGVLMLGGSK